MKYTKIIFFILILACTGSLVYFLATNSAVRLLFTETPKLEDNSVAKKQVFSNINKNTQKPSDKLAPEVEDQYKDDLMGKYIFELGWGIKEDDMSAIWDFEKTPFVAFVENFNAEDLTVTLKFSSPKAMPYIDSSKVLKTAEACTNKNTYVFYDSSLSVNPEKDFYKEVKPGMHLMSFCLDAECSGISKLCKLYVHENTP